MKTVCYQPHTGTVDALIKLHDDSTSELDNSNVKYIQNATLDFIEAFDRPQPAVPIKKLEGYKFKPSYHLTYILLFGRGEVWGLGLGKEKSRYISTKVGAPQVPNRTNSMALVFQQPVCGWL
jgi:hypothetical protein